MKWKPIWALGLALLVALALALVPLSQKRREAVHLFERVPGTQGCVALESSMWVSPDEVVCVTPASSKAFLTGSNGATLEAVDATSGQHRKIGAAPPNYAISGNFGVSVSPDGKWILWPGFDYDAKSNSQGAPRWNAMTLDGKRFVQRPRVADSNSSRGLAWLPDSSGWAEACVINRAQNGWTNGITLRVCSLGSNGVKKIDVKEATNANKTFAVTRAGEAVIGCDGRAGLFLVTVPLAKSDPTRTHQVQPPRQFNNGRIIARSLLSPRGDRIAWTFHDFSAQTASVWLSDINGKKFERVTPDLDKLSAAPRLLHWTVDGKTLACWRPTPGQNTGAYSLYRINIPESLSLKP